MVAITGRLTGDALELVRQMDRQAEIEALEEQLVWLDDEQQDDLRQEIEALENGGPAKPEPYDPSEAWPEGGRAPTFKENAASLRLEGEIVRRIKINRRRLRAFEHEKEWRKG